jgi:PAS domain S-box-containing protein
LALLVASVIIIASALSYLCVIEAVHRGQDAAVLSSAEAYAHLLSSEVSEFPKEAAKLRPKLKILARSVGAKSICVLTPQGLAYACSNHELEGSNWGRPEGRPPMSMIQSKPDDTVVSVLPALNEHLSAHRFPSDPGPLVPPSMFVRVESSSSGWVRMQKTIARRIVASGLAIALVCALGVFLATRKLLAPLKKVEEGLLRVKSGIFGDKLPAPDAPDFAPLVEGFNLMSRDLAASTVSLGLLDSILNGLEDPVIVLNADGTVRLANRAAEQVMGSAPHSLIGLRYSEIFPEPDEPGAKFPKPGIKRRALPSGREVHFLMSVSPLPGAGQDGVIVSCKDVTILKSIEDEHRRAREQAEASASFRSLIVASVSHELRTPLNGVLGMVQLLRRTPLAQTQLEYLGMLDEAGRQLLGIVNDILDYAKAEAGTVVFSSKPYSPWREIQSCVESFRAKATEKGIALLCEKDPDFPPATLGDARRFRQIVDNLVDNAVKYTEHGENLVRLSRKETEIGSDLLLSVADTGPGIPNESEPNLFTPFFRSRQTHAHKGGTGLGLAISKRLAEGMGGGIEFTNRPGHGCEFRVRLPFVAAEEPAAPTSAPTSAPTPAPPVEAGIRPRVLVVEDQPINRKVAVEFLKELGCEVESVADAEPAVEAALDPRFAAVFLDIGLPGHDGFWVAREIRRREPAGRRVPIIAVSAHVFEDVREMTASSGMDGFLPKPLDMDDLRATLARWTGLGRSKPARPLAEPPDEDSDEILHEHTWNTLSAGGRAGHVELAHMFIAEAEKHMARLRARWATGDVSAFREEAHALCGACLILGARRAAEACRAARTCVMNGAPPEVDAALFNLESELQAAGAEIRRRLSLP